MNRDPKTLLLIPSHVKHGIEAEVAATPHQVTERARAELILGHGHGLVDDERRPAGVCHHMRHQVRFECGEDLATVPLV